MNVKIIKFTKDNNSYETKFTVEDAVLSVSDQIITTGNNTVMCPSEWFNNEWVTKNTQRVVFKADKSQAANVHSVLAGNPTAQGVGLAAMEGFRSYKACKDSYYNHENLAGR